MLGFTLFVGGNLEISMGINMHGSSISCFGDVVALIMLQETSHKSLDSESRNVAVLFSRSESE